MISFAFQPESKPFPRWLGPYSPARGDRCGLRVKQGQLGAWMRTHEGSEFWIARANDGVARLVQLVLQMWRGGRLLFLPTGHVIKPLQDEDDRGKRVLVGRFRGRLVLESSEGSSFDLASPGTQPGDRWPGPETLGLEAVIGAGGELVCTWYHPTGWGQDKERAYLRGPDAALAKGFRKCRPDDETGRVRITACGHVTTNRQERGGDWCCRHVGWIDERTWSNWDHYAVRR